MECIKLERHICSILLSLLLLSLVGAGVVVGGGGNSSSQGGENDERNTAHKRRYEYFHEWNDEHQHSIGIEYFDSIEIFQTIINYNFW